MKIFSTLLFLFSLSIWAFDSESAMRGKAIYDNVCFACHGKNLEGATGHNLKDATWVHGGTTKEIANSITKGFPEKGMVAFGAVYKESQINDVVNYILSRQEGLRDMEYRIYHNATVENGIKWNRVFSSPNAALDLNADPFSSKGFVEKTNSKGTMGDLMSRSQEMSEKRKNKLGYDPVQKKYFQEYSKKRRGIKHHLDR